MGIKVERGRDEDLFVTLHFDSVEERQKFTQNRIQPLLDSLVEEFPMMAGPWLPTLSFYIEHFDKHIKPLLP